MRDTLFILIGVSLGILLCIAIEFLMIWLFPGHFKLAQGTSLIVSMFFLWLVFGKKRTSPRHP